MENILGYDTNTNILFVHNAKDKCHVTNPIMAKHYFKNLRSNKKTFIEVNSNNASGGACGPFHYHGMEGIEEIIAKKISKWIFNKISIEH